MRRICFLVVALFMTITSFAVTEEEAKAYFQRCILNLDPIEGFYSVEFRGNGSSVFGSAWSQYSNTTLMPDMYIVKMNEERDGRYLVCIGDTKSQNWERYWVLENIGTTQAYKFYVFNDKNEVIQSCQVVLNGGVSFTANFSNMSAAGNDFYQAGTGHSFQISFIKSFPTAEMYKAAVKEEIKKNYSSGTAFALNGNYFATNYHVYGNKKFALAKGIDNNAYHAYFVAGDEANDLAVFQIRDPKFTGFQNIPYRLATETAEIGEEVWTVGYPETDRLGDEAKYTKGEISALSGSSSDGEKIKTNDSRFYQITTPIAHGNSGGPLFDESGNLIGITSNGWSDLNNVNYAIKSQLLWTLLESFGLKSAAPDQNILDSLKQKDKIKMVKPYIFRVLCYNSRDVEAELLQDSLLAVSSTASVVQQPRLSANESDIILKTDSTKEDSTKNPTIITLKGGTYYYGDHALSKDEYIELIKTCDEAWDNYCTKIPKLGGTLMAVGGTLFVTGGVVLWYGLTKAKKDDRAEIGTIGALVSLPGAILTIVGGANYRYGIKKRNNAYLEYNNALQSKSSKPSKPVKSTPDRYINLQVCQNGIGVSFNF